MIVSSLKGNANVVFKSVGYSKILINLLVVCVGVLFCVTIFAADQPQVKSEYVSPFKLNRHIDTPLILMSGTLVIMPSLIGKQRSPDTCYPCDPSSVNNFDRGTINHYNKNLSLASDVLIVSLPLAGIGLSLASLAGEGGFSEVLVDTALLVETMAITIMFAEIVKHAFKRPRPYMYQDDPSGSKLKDSPDDISSFYSGHTSLAFATAASASYMFSVRNPRKKARYFVWASTMSAAASVAIFRVYSGKHFWTDVITGAIIGTATGVLIPALHRVKKNHQVSLIPGTNNLNLIVNF